MPERVRQRRTKGWRKPPGAMSVARSGRFGNRFVVCREGNHWLVRLDGRDGRIMGGPFPTRLAAATEAVALHADHVGTFGLCELDDDALAELRGHDLMCFCPLDAPCHADTLLELANQ